MSASARSYLGFEDDRLHRRGYGVERIHERLSIPNGGEDWPYA
jgi:hypothetical protein